MILGPDLSARSQPIEMMVEDSPDDKKRCGESEYPKSLFFHS